MALGVRRSMEFFVCGGRGDGVVTVQELGERRKPCLLVS